MLGIFALALVIWLVLVFLIMGPGGDETRDAGDAVPSESDPMSPVPNARSIARVHRD